MSESMKQLEKEYAKLRKKEKEKEERLNKIARKKILKQKIWALKHKKIMKAGKVITSAGASLGKGIIKTGKKIGEASRQIEKQKAKRKTKPKKVTRGGDDLMDFIKSI